MKKEAIESLDKADNSNLYIINRKIKLGIAFVYAILEIAKQLEALVNAQEFIARAAEQANRFK